MWRPLSWFLPGCVWLGPAELDQYADPDEDGVAGVAYGGGDCFPDDGDRIRLVCFRDIDGDGFGDPSVQRDDACACADTWVEGSGDCDDDDSALNPETTRYVDGDGDGFGGAVGTQGCQEEQGLVLNAADCDDTVRAIEDHLWLDRDGDGYGGLVEAACDDPAAVSNSDDCNDDPDREGALFSPETLWHPDLDGDSWGSEEVIGAPSCTAPNATAAPRAEDCDDEDPALNDHTVWFVDGDLDGFGAGPAVGDIGCEVGALPDGGGVAVPNDDDCDDTDPGFTNVSWDPVHDGDGDGYAEETALSLAVGDCSGVRGGDCADTDDLRGPFTAWYPDRDDDGSGADVPARVQCRAPGDGGIDTHPWVATDHGDCDDDNEEVGSRESGKVEVPDDGVDQDCDGADLPLACVRLPVDPTTIDAVLATAPPCATLVLAGGTYGPIVVPDGGVVALIADPFADVLFDGAAATGQTAIRAGDRDVILEGLRFERWEDGVFERAADLAVARSVSLRGVQVAESRFVVSTAPGLVEVVADFEEVHVVDVHVADGGGLAPPLSVNTLDIRGLHFDGALSAGPLVFVIAGSTEARGITVDRSAVTGPILVFDTPTTNPLSLRDVRVTASLGDLGLRLSGLGDVTLSDVLLEDTAFGGSGESLGVAVTTTQLARLTNLAVRRNRLDVGLATEARWLSVTSDADIRFEHVEVVGNDSDPLVSLVHVRRSGGDQPGVIELEDVALQADLGAALLLEDVSGPVDVSYATFAGFDALVIERDRGGDDVHSVEVEDSVIVTAAPLPPPPGFTTTRSTVLDPIDRDEPDWPHFTTWTPGLRAEWVDLRPNQSCVTPGCVLDTRGAYVNHTEACGGGGWATIDDCDDDLLYDTWEVLYFGGTSVTDGAGDADGDGLDEATEFVSGTVPVDRDSDHDGEADDTDDEPMLRGP